MFSEAKVLEIVKKTINPEFAEFFSGSLFVHCSPAEAVKLETALLKEASLYSGNNSGCGIVLSRLASESVFDFV